MFCRIFVRPNHCGPGVRYPVDIGIDVVAGNLELQCGRGIL